ncbi:hypothetical protein BpHYR1_047438 [Brachionus plicatilis]|uniref:Uncharacterized protein n=1 Tax=Brachionus plicatilis TaxID=10195 RepID=A0A3M7T9D5_BRAPC|nr:hypothetical protein BpHYR1_047438 [Brachionus plicatilis]
MVRAKLKRNPNDQDRLRKLKSNGTSDLLIISRAQLTHINVWDTELKEYQKFVQNIMTHPI